MRAEYTLLNRGRSHLTLNATTIPPHGKVKVQIDMTAELLNTLLKQHIEVTQDTAGGVLRNMEILRGAPIVEAVVAPVAAAPAPVVVAEPVAEPVAEEPVNAGGEPPAAEEAPVTEEPAAVEAEAATEEEAEAEDPEADRRKDLMSKHGNTLKATAKKLGVEGADGMKKEELVEKLLAFDPSLTA